MPPQRADQSLAPRVASGDVDDANALIQCLGGEFDRLPDVIRTAHRGTIRLAGTVRVERGRGLGGLIAALLRLPQSSEQCPMTVDGQHLADRMIWTRRFGGTAFRSIFVKRGDCLIEEAGPMRLQLRPVVAAGRLHYRLFKAAIGPLPLPSALMPSLVAWEGEREGRYEFAVELRLPLLGRLIRYGGLLDLEAEAA